MSSGRFACVACSLVYQPTPFQSLGRKTQPSFGLPSDQFCTLEATPRLRKPVMPAGKSPSFTATWEPVPLAPAFVQA